MPSDSFLEKGSTVTRTIRFDEAYESFLIEEAKKRGTSVNSLAEQIIRKYMLVYRFVDFTDQLVVGVQSLKQFVDSADEVALYQNARDTGLNRLFASLMRVGVDPSYASLPLVFEIGEIMGWFKTELILREQSDVYYLRHGFGGRWSLFVKNVLETYLTQVLELKTECTVHSSFVSFTVGHKK